MAIGLGWFNLRSVKVASVRPNLADSLPQEQGTRDQSINSKRVLIKNVKRARARKDVLDKKPPRYCFMQLNLCETV